MVTDRTTAIRGRLQTALRPDTLEITDESHLHQGHAGAASGGGHYRVRVISSCFENKSVLERHRMVYQAVNDLMPSEIHALSIKALTPEEQ